MMAVLFFDSMVYKMDDPSNAACDRFILSKGHACPALYGAWIEAGFYPESDLDKVRSFGCDLEGHPTPRLREIDVATGSLGQGLSVAAGMAFVGKYIDKAPYKVFCMMGDGESQEGSVWEALSFGSFYKLNNLIPIFDINRLGQSDPTMLQHDMEAYRARVESFGWRAFIIDGHDVCSIVSAFREARKSDVPTCILAKTFKGHGIPDIEDVMGWHGKPLNKDQAHKAIEALKYRMSEPEAAFSCTHGMKPHEPTWTVAPACDYTKVKLAEPLTYNLGDKVATRAAYGTALLKLGAGCDRVMAFDAEVKNSTMTLNFKNKYPGQFVECFIAEQNLVGAATGAACRDRAVVFASTFAAFFSRAYDQLRMGCISQTNLNLCGSHAGVSIGSDGPSQMALEDIAMFRALPTCTVFYPSDAVSCERAIELAAQTKGMTFTRTTRGATPVIYKNDEPFAVGQAKIVRNAEKPSCVIIGAGITLHESLAAAEELSKAGVETTVIDPFTIKPIDVKTIGAAVQAAGGNVVVVEDHYAEGGIGEAVMAGLTTGSKTPVHISHFQHLCVREVPRSGPDSTILKEYGIDRTAIAAAVKNCGC